MVYQLAEKPFLTVEFANGKKRRQQALSLDEKSSRAIFERATIVKSIVCGLNSARTTNSDMAEERGQKK